MRFKRVSKKECRVARQRALKLLNIVQRELSQKYSFTFRLVGSGKWGTMVKDEKGHYDLDYQILLTKNSKEYKNNKLKYATEIKQDFIGAFNKHISKNEKIENSTTAITLINKDEHHFHIDFVIIKLFPENNQIIRRNNKIETPSKNEFTWNELPQLNQAYIKFNNLSHIEKRDLIENYIIPVKCKEKRKDDNDETKISSAQVFVREVNNYGGIKKKNR